MQKQRSVEQIRLAGWLDRCAELVHVTHASDDDYRAIVAAGSHVVITPFTEMRFGYGMTPVMRMLENGIAPPLGNSAPRRSSIHSRS